MKLVDFMMADQSGLTFDVVIKITLPDVNEPITLSITLAPTDQVTVTDGSVKALQDCTLGELQQFANQFEADLLAAYESATLIDLTLNDHVHISVEAPSVDGKPSTPDELWLQHAVVYPSRSGKIKTEPGIDKAASGADPDQPGRAETPYTPHETPPAADEAAPGADPDQPGKEETPDTPLETPSAVDKAGDESLVAKEDIVTEIEPPVTVSEAEPVHEEREAVTEYRPAEPDQEEEKGDPFPDVVRPSIRILGRRRPLNHPTWTAVDILMNESAFRDTQAHAISSLDREVAGVLVGPQPEKQPDGRYIVHVTDMIIAKHTRMHGASVTYTPESWRYVNDRLNTLYPDNTAVIVGWYHTHPGFGIFLSGMDLFIHHNFFTQLWHIAMVLDPVARRTGFFCWDRPMEKVDKYEFPWPEWAPESW